MLETYGLKLNKDSMKKLGYKNSLSFQKVIESEDNYQYNLNIKLNIALVKKVGLSESVYLSNLIRVNRIFFEASKLDEEGYFPCLSEDIEETFKFSESFEKKCRNLFIEEKILYHKEEKGINYFKIDFEKYFELIKFGEREL